MTIVNLDNLWKEYPTLKSVSFKVDGEYNDDGDYTYDFYLTNLSFLSTEAEEDFYAELGNFDDRVRAEVLSNIITVAFEKGVTFTRPELVTDSDQLKDFWNLYFNTQSFVLMMHSEYNDEGGYDYYINVTNITASNDTPIIDKEPLSPNQVYNYVNKIFSRIVRFERPLVKNSVDTLQRARNILEKYFTDATIYRYFWLEFPEIASVEFEYRSEYNDVTYDDISSIVDIELFPEYTKEEVINKYYGSRYIEDLDPDDWNQILSMDDGKNEFLLDDDLYNKMLDRPKFPEQELEQLTIEATAKLETLFNN